MEQTERRPWQKFVAGLASCALVVSMTPVAFADTVEEGGQGDGTVASTPLQPAKVDLEKAATDLYNYVAENYDEAYADAYQKAAAAGYLDAAQEGLKVAEQFLHNEAKDFAKNAQMTDEFRAQLDEAIAEALISVDAAQEALADSNMSAVTPESLAKAEALLNQLLLNLEDVADLMIIAGSDLGEVAYQEFVTNVLPVIEQIAADTYAALVAGAQELYPQFVAAIEAAAQELPGEVADFIYNYLLNNPEEVIAFVSEYGPGFVEFVDQNQDAILAVLGWLYQNYGADVTEYVMNHPNEILTTMVDWFQTHGQNTWKLIKVYADALGFTAQVEAQIDALEAVLADLHAQLDAALDQMNQELAQAIRDQIAQIEAQIAQLESLINQINECIAQGKAQAEALIEEINGIIAEINGVLAEIEAAIADLQEAAEALDAVIKQAIADLDAAVDCIIETFEAWYGALQELPEKAEDAYNALLDYLKQYAQDQANKAAQWLYDYVKANAEQIRAMLEGLGEEALAYVQEHIDAIIETVEFLLEQFGEDVAEYLLANAEQLFEYMVYLVENFGEDAWDMIVTLIDASGIVDYVNAEVEDATHGTYVLSDDAYYVALGDSNAAGDGLGKKDATYAELLAAELGLSDDQFSDLTMGGLRTEDLRAILNADFQSDAYGQAMDLAAERDLYVSEIAKADLITVSTGADNLTTFVAEQVMAELVGNGAAPMDWAAFVGANNVEKVDAILAETEAYFVENGLDAEAAKQLTFVLEAYAYGYFGFAFNYTELINDIRGINADAQIVMVGMFNAIDDMVVTLPNGEEFAFGEYVDLFVGLTDAQFITYATTTDDVTYVAVPDTQVFFDEKVNPVTADYVMEFFLNKAGDLRPNAAGHQYIKEQILNAVTIAASIENAQVAVEDVVYNAKAQTPAVTVTVDGKELVEGTDFQVTYQNNVQVGTATAVVEGINAYGDKVSADFAVKHFATADSFKDFVADAWYLSEESGRGAFEGQKTLYLDYILATGIMNGYKENNVLNGLFGPNDTLKRADVATMLFRVANPDSTATTNPDDYVANATDLPDVQDGRYYTAAVNWCVEQGIVTGYKGEDKRAGKFVPNGNVTREELATMLYRFCVEFAGAEATTADISSFKDFGKIHSYALDAMAFCNAEAIMAGRIGTDGNRDYVDPRGNASRAEAAKMVAVSVRDVAEL